MSPQLQTWASISNNFSSEIFKNHADNAVKRSLGQNYLAVEFIMFSKPYQEPNRPGKVRAEQSWAEWSGSARGKASEAGWLKVMDLGRLDVRP